MNSSYEKNREPNNQTPVMVPIRHNNSSTNLFNLAHCLGFGLAADSAVRVESISGTPFGGAIAGDTVVMFPVSPPRFVSLTYKVPLCVTQHLISGLMPLTGYCVTATADSVNIIVLIAANGVSFTDTSGVLSINFTRIPQNFGANCDTAFPLGIHR